MTPGSAAAAAGLRAGRTSVVVEGESYLLGGDIIVAADGAPVSSQNQLRDLIARAKPGDRISLQVYRAHKRRTMEVKLGTRA